MSSSSSCFASYLIFLFVVFGEFVVDSHCHCASGFCSGGIPEIEVLVVSNTADRSIHLINLADGSICRTITAQSTISGLAADNLNQVLYYTDQSRLYCISFAGGESTQVGEFIGDTNTIFGLGFDQQTGILFGVNNGGIYEISKFSGATELLHDPAGSNLLSGIDIDIATGEIFVADDDGSSFSGPGIYSVDPFSGTYSPHLVPYPISLSDVDGVAVANNFLYAVEDGDNPNEAIHEIDLATGQVQRSFSIPYIDGSFNCAGTFAIVRPLEIPSEGQNIAELTALDDAMKQIMKLNDISAGMLSVSHQGIPVYHRAFGWKDEARKEPLPLNSMMRLASITKPLTASAVRKLVNDNLLALDDFVFDDGTNGGLLDLTPFGVPDPRIYEITVEHLLLFQGGWDRSIAGDHTFREIQIATEMGIPSPPGRIETVRWIMGRPLQFTPGTSSVYSNISFLLLGIIVEQQSGSTLIEYLRSEIFAPLGVLDCQLIEGRTFAKFHDEREPWYNNFGFTDENVFFPNSSDAPIVRQPYGGWDHEARIGGGGVVADPLALLEFVNHFTVIGDNIGGPRNPNESWTIFGSLTGTNTVARQRSDGINYVVLFNKRAQSFDVESYQSQIRNRIDQLMDDGLELPIIDVTVDLQGDLNCDGLVNLLDVTPFVELLLADRYSPRADLNMDGNVDLLDIGPFVDLLTGT